MQKILMIGLMLLNAFSCSTGHIKEPQPVFVISTKFMSVAAGKKDFNYKNGHDSMGEWISDPKIIKWSELPQDLVAFPLEIWLKKIKPAIKELSRKHRDDND